MLAFVAFELDAKGFLKRRFDGLEGGEGMVFSAGAGLASVRGEQPRYIFGLREWGAVQHNAAQKVREEAVVLRVYGAMPEVV